MVDGEMQADTAVVPADYRRDLPLQPAAGRSQRPGFPDLESGNIAYKLLQRMGGAELIGPMLMGLSKPVHVLQRGAEVNDIVHVAAIAVVTRRKSASPIGR